MSALGQYLPLTVGWSPENRQHGQMGNFFSDRKAVVARLVAVMDHRRNDRQLALSQLTTRCVLKDEIHEFLLCNPEKGAEEGLINEISYLGFAEFQDGGVIAVGDEVWIDREPVGEVLGFDETHMPNHMNIVLRAKSLQNGAERSLYPEQSLVIRSLAA